MNRMIDSSKVDFLRDFRKEIVAALGRGDLK
jgi:hypothetical protein